MHGGRERQYKPWVRQNAGEEKSRQDDARDRNGYDKYRSGMINIEVMTKGRLDMRKMRGMRGQISSGTRGTNTNGHPKSRVGFQRVLTGEGTQG